MTSRPAGLGWSTAQRLSGAGGAERSRELGAARKKGKEDGGADRWDRGVSGRASRRRGVGMREVRLMGGAGSSVSGKGRRGYGEQLRQVGPPCQPEATRARAEEAGRVTRERKLG